MNVRNDATCMGVGALVLMVGIYVMIRKNRAKNANLDKERCSFRWVTKDLLMVS